MTELEFNDKVHGILSQLGKDWRLKRDGDPTIPIPAVLIKPNADCPIRVLVDCSHVHCNGAYICQFSPNDANTIAGAIVIHEQLINAQCFNIQVMELIVDAALTNLLDLHASEAIPCNEMDKPWCEGLTMVITYKAKEMLLHFSGSIIEVVDHNGINQGKVRIPKDYGRVDIADPCSIELLRMIILRAYEDYYTHKHQEALSRVRHMAERRLHFAQLISKKYPYELCHHRS